MRLEEITPKITENLVKIYFDVCNSGNIPGEIDYGRLSEKIRLGTDFDAETGVRLGTELSEDTRIFFRLDEERNVIPRLFVNIPFGQYQEHPLVRKAQEAERKFNKAVQEYLSQIE